MRRRVESYAAEPTKSFDERVTAASGSRSHGRIRWMPRARHTGISRPGRRRESCSSRRDRSVFVRLENRRQLTCDCIERLQWEARTGMVTLSQARIIVDAALAAAASEGVPPLAVVVLDEAGNIVLAAR